MVTSIKSLISQQAQGIREDALAHKNVQTEILQLNEYQILPQEEKVFTFFLLDKGHFQIPPILTIMCYSLLCIISKSFFISYFSVWSLPTVFVILQAQIKQPSHPFFLLYFCSFLFPLFNHLYVLTLSAFLSMLSHTNLFLF